MPASNNALYDIDERSHVVPDANPGGVTRGAGVIDRIKAIHGLSLDSEVAVKLQLAPSTLSQWRHGDPNYGKVMEYCREHRVSLEYVINGREPARLADLYRQTPDIYQVKTDQDVVYDIAASVCAVISGHQLDPAPHITKRTIRQLHREYLESGVMPSEAKIRAVLNLD